jgi:DNA-binding FadR family transcriptional regulator
MTIAAKALKNLRTWHCMPARELLERLDVSRPTMMRALKELGSEVIVRGKARRTGYAARRTLRGSQASLPLFRIDETGHASDAGVLDLVYYPHGCVLA